MLHMRRWQLQRDRNREVFIYDGLKDSVVDHAMDEPFGRIQAMMFVRTVVTDGAGQPAKDPETGEVVVEQNDCE